MDRFRQSYRVVVFRISLFLLLSGLLLACTTSATRLASLKANYNEGKWGYVLGTAKAEGAYSADEVIDAAGSDTLTADQAKLIKARALMQVFIQDKLAAGVDAENDPQVAQALTLVKELSAKDFSLNWMNVELMAAIADYFYLSDNYVAAFDAYDYLLTYANFDSLQASQRQYIRRWVEMKRQLDDMLTSDAYKKYTRKQFKKTYTKVIKSHADDVGVVEAGIIILADEGQPRAAVQRAMLARFTAAKNPKTQKQYVQEIDVLVESILEGMQDAGERKRLGAEYNRFRTGWDAGAFSPAN